MSKRKLFVLMLVCVLIVASCDLNSNLDSSGFNDCDINENDFVQDDYSSIESNVGKEGSNNILDDPTSFFEDVEQVDVVSFYDNTEIDIYDTMTFESKDSEYNDKVINTYLIERAFNPYEPISVISKGELKLGEYYINKTNKKIAFILRVWNLELETPKQVYILCITFDMSNNQDLGYVQYDYNDDGQLFKEIFYDKEFMMISDIEYELYDDFPFPLVRKYSIFDDDNKYVNNVLNRSEKFFFLTDRMNKTADGLPIDYTGDIFRINQREDLESNCDKLTFDYDQENRLKSISGSLVNEDFCGNKKQGKFYETGLKVEIDYLIGSGINILSILHLF